VRGAGKERASEGGTERGREKGRQREQESESERARAREGEGEGERARAREREEVGGKEGREGWNQPAHARSGRGTARPRRRKGEVERFLDAERPIQF